MSGTPKEVEEHAAHGRKFFGGAECRCPICVGHRDGVPTTFTVEEVKRCLIEATYAEHSDHTECEHIEHCVYVDLEQLINDIMFRRKPHA